MIKFPRYKCVEGHITYRQCTMIHKNIMLTSIYFSCCSCIESFIAMHQNKNKNFLIRPFHKIFDSEKPTNHQMTCTYTLGTSFAGYIIHTKENISCTSQNFCVKKNPPYNWPYLGSSREYEFASQ